MQNQDNNPKSIKDKFDKKFPEAKMLREMELKRASRELFNKSTVGKTTSIIYLTIALLSIFVYWKFFEVNIFLSVFLGILTWFVFTHIFDKIFIKLLGVEKAVRKINDEEIEIASKKLEKRGVSMDKLLK